MDADWYVDPLDRFDGRYFNGERWTERVSHDGKLVVDPDFATQTDLDGASGFQGAVPTRRAIEPVAPALAHPDSGPHASTVERRSIRPKLPAADIAESPVRTVAVLEMVGGASRSQPNRSYLLWVLLGLVAVLAIVGLWLLRGNDAADEAVAEPVDLADDQAQRVDDLEAGGVDDGIAGGVVEELEVDAPVGVVEPDTTFDADELIEVGALRVLNGTSVLLALESWHREFVADRGIELPDDAGCWFGQLGGAAVQVAHCGPVGGSADTEYLYDGVPLAFEDVPGGQIAQPVVDAVTLNEVLANALTLVGPNAPD